MGKAFKMQTHIRTLAPNQLSLCVSVGWVEKPVSSFPVMWLDIIVYEVITPITMS